MSDKQARQHALSEWLLEFSVLWAVFPVLDQLIEGGPILKPYRFEPGDRYWSGN